MYTGAKTIVDDVIFLIVAMRELRGNSYFSVLGYSSPSSK
jgi:hypothetical protein